MFGLPHCSPFPASRAFIFSFDFLVSSHCILLIFLQALLSKLQSEFVLMKKCPMKWVPNEKSYFILLIVGNEQTSREFCIAESNICLWHQHRMVKFASKVIKKKFTGSQKRRHPEMVNKVFKFIKERRKHVFPVSI